MKGFSVLRVIVAVIVLSSVSVHAYAQCANPAGVAGDMTYNDNEYVMQWCDGTNWYGTSQSPYIPNAVYFDSPGDDFETNALLTGVPDSKQFSASFWIYHNSTGQNRVILTTDGNGGPEPLKISLRTASTSRLLIEARNASSTEILNVQSSSALPLGQWNHIMFSFDLSNPANRHLYINGVDDMGTITTYTDDVIDFTPPGPVGFRIGSNIPSSSPLRTGGLSDFWIDFGTYIDLSVSRNRAQFIGTSGWPVDLGIDGSKPTGFAPDVYLTGATASWTTNNGTGGGFSAAALTDAGSHPAAYFGPLDGLIGWWKLDETSGATAFDSSGNGNDATIINFGNALFLPGVIGGSIDSSVSNPTTGGVRFEVTGVFPLGVNPPFSVAMWVNRERGFEALFANGILSGTQEIRVHRDNYRVSMSPTNFSPSISPTYNEWHHVTLTYDGTTFRIYINGILEDSAARTLTTTVDTFTFGGIGGSNGNSGARLDDVRLYDREVSAAEITELYETGFPCKNPVGQRDGDTMYNLTHHVPQFCDLREWVSMTPAPGDGGAGCSNPTAEEGDMMYNASENFMQYCEGDTWQAMGVN